ncbi:MAG: BrxA/BrxB family bacilliredoxin [Bacteroidota bacterium]|nr:BrxA/BrxB family bacilliredoxin [Bacteroidota bacterium]
MPYPEMLVAPMRAELTNVGFTELKTIEEVDSLLPNAKGVSMVVVNSVCGCAAGAARPGIIRSLTNEKKPDNLFTVFAGQDTEAVNKAREFMLPYPPSSPSVALFKDGKLVHFVQRLEVEGHTAEQVAENLRKAYDQYC